MRRYFFLTLLGILWAKSGNSYTIQLVGQMAIPLMLLTLGFTVGKLKSSGLLELIFPSILKFLLCVMCALTIVFLFDLDEIPTAALIIQVTMPVAVSS
ncbi:MAG: hypothetical protein CL532_06905 [Aestuariivita sp.]|nr:hypothetical protein [Aestuariivita sp.]